MVQRFHLTFLSMATTKKTNDKKRKTFLFCVPVYICNKIYNANVKNKYKWLTNNLIENKNINKEKKTNDFKYSLRTLGRRNS